MEHISPTHHFILHIILSIKNSEALQPTIKTYLKNTKTDFCNTLNHFLIACEHNSDRTIINQETNIYRKTLLELLWLGLNGHQILDPLIELEKDMEKSCSEEIEGFLRLLPFKMLIPLYIFIFPAYLLVLIGPILKNLLESL